MAQTANKQKQAATPETGTATVTVALKHPTGIVLEVFEKKILQVPDGVGRLRDETIFRSTGKQYALNGNRVPFGKMPNYKIIAGYALTDGIPKVVWETWLEQHQDSPLVENKLIMAYEKQDMAEDFANDHQATRSGFEPLLIKGDPRVDKKKTRDGKFVDVIQPDGEAIPE